ncbi:hypothetical protein PoB_002371400 [Plakobranchus ocellatus]|uniref:Uncharacterized protein n=1 Tax=Plakobranchus ocellatus TaxID=259542 RepID=A0AAV3ZTL1_9GAST|nr:hypothetical protein PoB_002371400 [Plakobranchus ocellatus]
MSSVRGRRFHSQPPDKGFDSAMREDGEKTIGQLAHRLPTVACTVCGALVVGGSSLTLAPMLTGAQTKLKSTRS